MSQSSHHFDVIISGGGLVGLALAVALGRESLRVAVVEQNASELQLSSTFDGRVSAIAKGSQNLLQAIGVWEHVAPYAEPIRDIRVSDADSPFFLHYACDEVGADAFGCIAENRDLRAALLKIAEECSGNITLFAPAQIAQFITDPAGVEVILGNGRSLRSSLLVGADGKNSRLRREAGIGVMQTNYAHSAIVCTIEHELPHQGLAQERFLPVGPFAVLPMRGNRSSLVWTEPQERIQTYLGLPDDEFNQEIAGRVGVYLGAVKAVGPRYRYPLSLVHAARYTSQRLALIGDAAHAIHPIAGQGVNLGYRDVAVLAELLVEAKKNGQDIGDASVLAHYERWRRFDTMTMMLVTDGMTRLFSNNLLPLKLARGLGLAVVGKIPPLKKFFMRHAMGLVGDVPRLMRPVR